MRLLLDTHVLLWWLQGDTRLSAEHYTLINAGQNQVFVSAASVWEAAIKQTAGKLKVPGVLGKTAVEQGLTALPIALDHATVAGALPPHHKDPFDRMLVAQAQVEALSLMTHDAALNQYDVHIVPV